jgi:5-carboxymethyl-2-hydroxymuconate isomerase
MKKDKFMPHFVIDCSENIINLKSPQEIIQKVYNTAEASNLFEKGDIKVRINPFKYYTIGNTQNDFIHIFANIMEGRTAEQKKTMSDSIIKELKTMFPDVPIISINVRDFEKATYCNKSMI